MRFPTRTTPNKAAKALTGGALHKEQGNEPVGFDRIGPGALRRLGSRTGDAAARMG
jgi:hypothetical protein